jgi:hypothetical protein
VRNNFPVSSVRVRGFFKNIFINAGLNECKLFFENMFTSKECSIYVYFIKAKGYQPLIPEKTTSYSIMYQGPTQI